MILKRINAPKTWNIERKSRTFIVGTSPGPHSKKESLPIAIVLREMLGYAQNMKEVNAMLNMGVVKINNKIKRSKNIPVGIMDIIEVGKDAYRVLPITQGFSIIKMDKNEEKTTLRKITNKKMVKKGKVQLNFHDGTNLLVENDEYKTGDVVVFDFEKNSIKEKIEFKKGNMVLITQGKNRGTISKLEKIIETKSSKPNLVVLKSGDEKKLLPKEYVFIIGCEKPLIAIGE